MLDFSLNRRIAISRGFGLVLNKDGSQTFVGHCSDMPQLHSNERLCQSIENWCNDCKNKKLQKLSQEQAPRQSYTESSRKISQHREKTLR